MPFERNEDLPERIRAQFPGAEAQTAFRGAFNGAYAGTCQDRGEERESCAFAIATAAAKKPGAKSVVQKLVDAVLWVGGAEREPDAELVAELRAGYAKSGETAPPDGTIRLERAPDGRVRLERIVPIAKVDVERQIVASVVYEPDVVDAHGDSMTAAEIEKSAHGFMARYAQGHGELGTDHRATAPRVAVVPIECYLAPVDFQLGSQAVKKGSWILFAKIFDAEIWKAVKAGRFTGWSFEGWGIRSPA